MLGFQRVAARKLMPSLVDIAYFGWGSICRGRTHGVIRPPLERIPCDRRLWPRTAGCPLTEFLQCRYSRCGDKGQHTFFPLAFLALRDASDEAGRRRLQAPHAFSDHHLAGERVEMALHACGVSNRPHFDDRVKRQRVCRLTANLDN